MVCLVMVLVDWVDWAEELVALVMVGAWVVQEAICTCE